MKFPYQMLRDYVDTALDASSLGDLLTMAGFELEEIEEVEGDWVLDVKVMSNRGDGLSVLGLAREVLAKDASSRPTELYRRATARFDDVAGEPGGDFPVRIETEACHRYVGWQLHDAKNGESPEWLQRRIRQAGWRPISLLVDLTNYVLLETGQPLHVFDEASLHGPAIVVREARQDEKLTTLNEVEHELLGNQMMICDADRPVAAAGIMGGLETEVGPSTTRVLLESAAFKNTSIRKTRKQMGLSTEASYRFERSVDPEGVLGAARRFMELAAQLGGGKPAPSLTDVYPAPPAPKELTVRLDRCEALLGLEFSVEEARRILEALGFGCEWEQERTVRATAPTWRPDIQREEDVAEELGRVHGYDRIPERLPSGTTLLGGPQGTERWIDQVRHRALRAGFAQTISHSLRDLHALDGPEPRVGPRNPGSPEMAYLRNSLLASLGDNARRNGGQNLALFEIGRVFAKASPYAESRRLGLYAHGALRDPYLGSQEESASFFSMKAALEAALQDVDLSFGAPAEPDARLHPTQQAEVLAGGTVLGRIGTIHPDAAEAAGLPEGAVLAEIDLDTAYPMRRTEHRPKPISRNPSVRRDLAILIDRAVPYAQIEKALEQSGGELLERHWLFDVYRGAGIPEGKHSLAIALQFRKMGSNLTDEEANQARETVVAALEGLGATRR